MSTSQGGDSLPTLLCCDRKNLSSGVAWRVSDPNSMDSSSWDPTEARMLVTLFFHALSARGTGIEGIASPVMGRNALLSCVPRCSA